MEKELVFLRVLGKRKKLSQEEAYLKEKIEYYLKTLKGLGNLKD